MDDHLSKFIDFETTLTGTGKMLTIKFNRVNNREKCSNNNKSDTRNSSEEDIFAMPGSHMKGGKADVTTRCLTCQMHKR